MDLDGIRERFNEREEIQRELGVDDDMRDVLLLGMFDDARALLAEVERLREGTRSVYWHLRGLSDWVKDPVIQKSMHGSIADLETLLGGIHENHT